MTSETTAPDTPGNPVDALKERRHRKLYIEMRLPRLQNEIKELAEEKRKLAKDDNSKESTATRIYANHRIGALREEMNQLEEEKKAIFTKLREQRGTDPGTH